MNFFLKPFELLLYLVNLLRRLLYQDGVFQSKHLPGTVISVGNVQFGGTGKTPFVVELANKITQLGGFPAILTRGYGSELKAGTYVTIMDGVIQEGSRDFGLDEPLLISSSCKGVPVIAGSRRWKNAQAFLAQNSSVKITHWILDDGFQHLGIHRDLDICLIDHVFHQSSFWVRDPSREPVAAAKHALRVVTRYRRDLDPQGHLASQVPCIRFDLCKTSTTKGKDFDPSRTTGAFFAIAQGKRLTEQIRKKFKIDLVCELTKGDHQPISVNELEILLTKCEQLVISNKDYFRQRDLFDRYPGKIFMVGLHLHFIDSGFWQKNQISKWLKVKP